MEYNVDIAVQDPQWSEVKELETLTNDVIRRTLDMADVPEKAAGTPFEVSVVFVNDDMIRILNKEYRGKNKPTNVLSFAMLDEENDLDASIFSLGDIILAYETIEKEARENDRFIRDHIAHLLVHGTLHLLGYDHIEDDDANVMETLEIRILEGMDIQNPYLQTI